MRHQILPRVLVLVLCCSAGRVMADDSTIAQDLAGRMRQAKTEGVLKDFRIGVKVEDGVVWLSGNVTDDGQRQRALDVARRVPGVRLVVNDLECESDRQPAPEPILSESTDLPPSAHGPVVRRESFEESANVPARHVASQLPSPPAPQFPSPPTREMSEQPPLNEPLRMRMAVQGAPPLPPGAIVLVPGYSAVPAYPVPPHLQPMAPPSAPPTQASPKVARAAPAKPVPVARNKPARLVNYHTDMPPYQEGMCQDGMCPGGMYQDGPSYGGMAYDGMSYDGGSYGGSYGAPVPEYGAGGGMSGVMYDNPQMPGYAWPSYAAYPNYAAVTYPRQYSPMAWPYIGPFYPYPQVPLGWRKVCLEWDDGWWMLDFKSK